MPFVVIIAGPNGAGKTSFSVNLRADHTEVPFINADEIARSLPDDVTASARDMRAGRLMIEAVKVQLAAGESFFLETTLATRRYLREIPIWQAAGYEVDLYYLRLPSADDAVRRVARRVAANGHSFPEAVIRRRFERSLDLFEVYKFLVDTCYLVDSMEGGFEVVLVGEKHGEE